MNKVIKNVTFLKIKMNNQLFTSKSRKQPQIITDATCYIPGSYLICAVHSIFNKTFITFIKTVSFTIQERVEVVDLFYEAESSLKMS